MTTTGEIAIVSRQQATIGDRASPSTGPDVRKLTGARPRAARATRVSRRLDYSRRLGLVRAPTLVLASRFDPQMPFACAEELVRGIPGSRLAVFERSGHYPFIEEPDAFWATVQSFLAERYGDTAEPLLASVGGDM